MIYTKYIEFVGKVRISFPQPNEYLNGCRVIARLSMDGRTYTPSNAMHESYKISEMLLRCIPGLRIDSRDGQAAIWSEGWSPKLYPEPEKHRGESRRYWGVVVTRRSPWSWGTSIIIVDSGLLGSSYIERIRTCLLWSKEKWATAQFGQETHDK